jgi:hypothetical protein
MSQSARSGGCGLADLWGFREGSAALGAARRVVGDVSRPADGQRGDLCRVPSAGLEQALSPKERFGQPLILQPRVIRGVVKDRG